MENLCLNRAKAEKQGKFNSSRQIQLWENKNFSYQKSVLREEEETKDI